VVTKFQRGVVAVALIAIAGCANDAERDAPPAVPETQGYVTADDGTRIFYRLVGNGPSVVVLPGDLFLNPALRPLVAGRTLVFYDMRNRGHSDSVSVDHEISIQRDVADLENLRTSLHLDVFDLVGWSYLGLMVALYTVDHPEHVRRLVQIGPVPMRFGTQYPSGLGPADYTAALDTTALNELHRLRANGYPELHPRDYCEAEWAVTRFALVGDPIHVGNVPAAPCDMPNEWPTRLVNYLARQLPSIEKLDLKPARIKALTMPVLVVHGTVDRNAPYGSGREWALTLPDARLVTIEGAAHCPWADQPEQVIAAIRTFLDGAWPPGAEDVATLERPAAGHS